MGEVCYCDRKVRFMNIQRFGKSLATIGINPAQLLQEKDHLEMEDFHKLEMAMQVTPSSSVQLIGTLLYHALPLCFLLKKRKKGWEEFKLVSGLNMPKVFMDNNAAVEFFDKLGVELNFKHESISIGSQNYPSFATIRLKVAV